MAELLKNLSFGNFRENLPFNQPFVFSPKERKGIESSARIFGLISIPTAAFGLLLTGVGFAVSRHATNRLFEIDQQLNNSSLIRQENQVSCFSNHSSELCQSLQNSLYSAQLEQKIGEGLKIAGPTT